MRTEELIRKLEANKNRVLVRKKQILAEERNVNEKLADARKLLQKERRDRMIDMIEKQLGQLDEDKIEFVNQLLGENLGDDNSGDNANVAGGGAQGGDGAYGKNETIHHVSYGGGI